MKRFGALRHDRLLVWDGELPYRTLARLGITPESTAKQVLDASFDMTPDDLRDDRVNAAWESLRSSRRRLIVDFFAYLLPEEPPPEAAPGPGPMPALPWAALRDIAEDWSAALAPLREVEVPEAIAPPVLGGAAATGQKEDGEGS